MMIEGCESGAGSRSVFLTNGSGFGTGRPRNISYGSGFGSGSATLTESISHRRLSKWHILPITSKINTVYFKVRDLAVSQTAGLADRRLAEGSLQAKRKYEESIFLKRVQLKGFPKKP
jgi:hypothetical protein